MTAASPADVGIRVSVVVPVYNPGRYLEPLVDSLLAQTMTADAFEVVFVDDGSTDGTPARLDQLAAKHEHFSVIHQPNSGWPGRPRNVGVDHARGDYVFFSDNDDWFGVEALERLVRVADEQNADIVIGRMVGHNRGVPRELFRRDRLDATIETTQLEDSLTPHKLFRRRLLLDHDLRFPEGKRRLEDHVFVMRAYFAARRICVVSDYDYYHHISRDDESNAGFGDIDPDSYYGYVRDTVDVVLANTSPGPVQDRLLRRFLTIEVLGRVADPRLADAPETFRRSLFDAARRLVVDTIPESADAEMRARQRVLARHLRDGDRAALERDARHVPTSRGTMTTAAWRSSVIELGWWVTVQPALLRRAADGGWLLATAADELRVDADLRGARVDLLAVDAAKGERVLGSSPVGVDASGCLTATGTTAIDPLALGDGAWRLRIRVRALGWVVDTRALVGHRAWRRLQPSLVGPDAVLVQPAAARSGTALLAVGGAATWLDDTLVARVRVDGARLVLPAAPRGASEVQLRVATSAVDAAVDSTGAVTVGGREGGVALRARRGTGRWISLGVQSTGGRLSRSTAATAYARARRLSRDLLRQALGPVDRWREGRR